MSPSLAEFGAGTFLFGCGFVTLNIASQCMMTVCHVIHGIVFNVGLFCLSVCACERCLKLCKMITTIVFSANNW